MPGDLPALTLPAIFGTSFLVGLTGALVPGPLFILVVLESVRQGFWVGARLVLGHAISELGIVILLAIAMSQLLKLTSLTSLVGVPGGAFLIWMAWRVYYGAPEAAVSLQNPLRAERGSHLARSPRSLIVLGVIVSVSNPYWLLWWTSVGATYVEWALEAAAVGLAAFYLGHILADFGWYGAMGAAVSAGRQIMSPRIYLATLRGCATFLGFLGVIFILQGMRTVLGGGG